jgi:hypothetical protein
MADNHFLQFHCRIVEERTMRKVLILAACLVSGPTFAGEGRLMASKSIIPAKAQKALPQRIAKPQEKAQAKMPLQGEVAWVDASRQVLWIRWGQANGLKPRMKLQVMQKLDDEVVKGQVEVTRMLAPHMAEARILSQEEKNPLAQGDSVIP